MELDSKIEEVTAEDLHDRNEEAVISKEDAEKSDELLDKIENFLKDNKEAGKKDDDEKTKLYGEVKELWGELSNHINNIGFNFHINDEEYRLMKKYIINKCEYDHQTVFMGVQLKEDFFVRAENHRKNGEPIQVTCNETVLIHHLFENGGFNVKGLHAEAYAYRNIMTAIGNVNKYYNELDVASKRAGDEINNWVQGLDAEEQQSTENNAEEA
jgi:hypothetical protein